MATKVCIFNQTSKLIDVVDGAVTSPGTAGTPVVLNSLGVLDPTMMNTGGTAIVGATALTAGMLINLYSNAGVLTAKPASAASATQASAMGFVLGAYNPGSTATIFFAGVFDYTDTHVEFSDADLGVAVYLSDVDLGGITKTRPSTVGSLDQVVGYVVGYNAGVVSTIFLAGFEDFTRISGIASVAQGGTGSNLSATGGIHQVLQQSATGAAITVGQLAQLDINSTVVTVTANYAALVTDFIILANGTFTVTLPSASLTVGQQLRIKNIGTGTIIINAAALMDGQLNLTLSTQYQSVDLIWDGTTWWVL